MPNDRLQASDIKEWIKQNPALLDNNPDLKEYLGPAGDEKKELKYHNLPTEYNGRTYQSAEEAKYAWGLDMQVRAGEIPLWLPQVRFPLPGGYCYVADFLVFDWTLNFTIVDVKGERTRVYINKKKAFKACYKREIVEVNTKARVIRKNLYQTKNNIP
jgi:Protein of unknown function (DUF1064).